MTTPRAAASATVAAFDLDGTLTRRDTLLPFLVLVAGPMRTGWALVRESFSFALVVLGRRHRDVAKERLLVRLLRGRSVSVLEPIAEGFARTARDRLLRPWALERIQWHRANDHEVIIVTASPELYVSAIGQLLGADAVLGTRLATDATGRLSGRILGRNCRGAEKVERIRAWLGDRSARLIAYGNSAGDTQMLAIADVAVKVDRRPPPQPPLDADPAGA